MNDLLDTIAGERERPPVYVGQGLKQRTYEECIAEGLNPNPNPPGRIFLPDTSTPEGYAKMVAHVKAEQEWALKALRDE